MIYCHGHLPWIQRSSFIDEYLFQTIDILEVAQADNSKMKKMIDDLKKQSNEQQEQIKEWEEDYRELEEECRAIKREYDLYKREVEKDKLDGVSSLPVHRTSQAI